ncbi:MAG: HlyD family efflux transporter periplasmic adaptor subunit [Phycisphaerales bacterium]|nr:HlyD family efflux transporter periplasmic adaptor subunit [Phycisphaerales bacterium]
MRRDENREYRVAVGAEPADRGIASLRADLQVSPQLFYGQLCFVIKDPVTLKYYRLQPIEHFLVTQFDGKKTARDMLGLIQQQFPESSLGVQDVLRFVGMLHESHLLLGEGTGHAEWLTKRRTAARNKRFLGMAQNFLFFKVPLFHPDRLLAVMNETVGRVIFRPVVGVLAMLLVMAGAWNVLMNTDRLANLPYNLLTWQNLAIMYCVFIGTKVFHEFGHGLTAKRFGGEISSMGVIMLVMTPSFYCDTSDAWMIPSRWARLWINAGGIVVELVIAAIASFVWLYTPTDGIVNQISLNVMISCSVATLFFNANPLLRFDGYYFLADLLEIPNLMSKGRQHLGYYAQKHLLGLKPMVPPDTKRAPVVMVYAVLSMVYRWVVVFAIIGLLYYFFDRYGMGPIGIFLAVLYVVLTVLWPLGQMMRFVWKQRWHLTRRLTYAGGAAVAGVGVLVGIALMPWTLAIKQPLVVLSKRDEVVRVQSPGYVASVLCDVGERVKAGDVIMTLSDPTLEATLDCALSRYEEESIKAEAAAAGNKLPQLIASRQVMEALKVQIKLLKKQKEDLVIQAPIDGVVIRDTSLKGIVGNFVPAGVVVCRVIRTDLLEACISLPQQQAAMVKEGMTVRIRLWSNASAEMRAKVVRVSTKVSDQLLHPALASSIKGEVDVKADENGEMHSTGRRSTVFIELPVGGEDGPAMLADGMTGRGEIEVRRTTVIGRIWRAVLDSTTPDWHL